MKPKDKYLLAAQREIERLRGLVNHLKSELAKVESASGKTIPVAHSPFAGTTLRVMALRDQPVVVSDDLVAALRKKGVIEKRAGRGRTVTAELKGLGLGARELIVLTRNDLAAALNVTSRTAGKALGLSVKAGYVGFVTPLGIETLERHAPGISAWFAQAVKQLPNC